jgi:thiol-disulfide isomerase/thioredoxin
MERNNTLRNFVLAGLALFAFFIVMGNVQIMPAPAAATPETTLFVENSLVELDGDGLRRIVEDGKPTLLFVYASWCPYCKQQFDVLEQMTSPELAITYASLDEDAHALSAYLIARYPDMPFTPYLVRNRYSFDAALDAYGFNADGGIPHLMVFDANGKPVQEFKGLTSEQKLRAALAKAA